MRTPHSVIWETIRNRIPRDVWMDTKAIYALVESAIPLSREDLEPVTDYDSTPKWRRDVRHVLHYRKGTEEMYRGKRGAYMLPSAEGERGRMTRSRIPSTTSDEGGEIPFSLAASKDTRQTTLEARTGQQAFRLSVERRYGRMCAVCGLDIVEMLEAAHLRECWEDGSFDPRNGLILCRNHHSALDSGLFAFEPPTNRIKCGPYGPTLGEMGITRKNLSHLPKLPHPDAIKWVWEKFSLQW